MNQQQKQLAVFAASTVAFTASLVASKMLDVRKTRIRAEQAKIREENNIRFMTQLNAVTATLDKQLQTARFWEQVTGPEMKD